jgi:hypothetical protein
MNNLAPELLHMICRNLRFSEVYCFRLINRDCAAVGLEYLVPWIEIHLHRHSYRAHSLVRLQAIASHPFVSKGVRELSYDSLTFDSPMKDFETWKAKSMEKLDVRKPREVNDQRSELKPYRTRSDYKRMYAWYQVCMKDQQYFVDRKMERRVLLYSLPNLTNLEKITMNTYNTMDLSDVYENFGPWDYTLECPRDQSMRPGVRQLNSLLLAVADSEIKLKKLRAGKLSWNWFRTRTFNVHQEQLARACESLTSLHLVLNCWGQETIWEQKSDCYWFLQKTSAIGHFLAKMPHLESLKIRFDATNMAMTGLLYPARLNHLISEGHTWPKLRKLELGNLQTSESQLADLLERHASTLKDFRLTDEIGMDAGGSWISLLQKLKGFRMLEKVGIQGDLTTRGGPDTAEECWDIWQRWYPITSSGSDDPAPWDLENYLLRDGPFPLTEDNMHSY